MAPVALVASTVTSPCGAMTGAVASFTVILKLLVPVLPAESALEQLTVAWPIANVEPETGVQVASDAPSTLSKALTV